LALRLISSPQTGPTHRPGAARAAPPAEGSSSHDLLHTLQVLDNEIRALKRVEEEEEEGRDD
jgi:hypothetical protein